jgi:hypothetical protein
MKNVINSSYTFEDEVISGSNNSWLLNQMLREIVRKYKNFDIILGKLVQVHNYFLNTNIEYPCIRLIVNDWEDAYIYAFDDKRNQNYYHILFHHQDGTVTQEGSLSIIDLSNKLDEIQV